MGFPTGFQSWSNGILKEIKTVLQGILIVDATGQGDVPITLDGEKPTVKPNALIVENRTKFDVDASSVLVFDGSARSTAVVVSICNAGDEVIYLDINATPTSTSFIKKLASGETWEFPIAGTGAVTTNDINAIRDSAQANDDVIVISWTES